MYKLLKCYFVNFNKTQTVFVFFNKHNQKSISIYQLNPKLATNYLNENGKMIVITLISCGFTENYLNRMRNWCLSYSNFSFGRCRRCI